MQEKQYSGKRQKRWRQILDPLLLLSWRKLLLVLIIWALTAALTWAFFDLLNDLFSSAQEPVGGSVTDIIRESNGDLVIATWGGAVLPSIVFVIGTLVIPLYLVLALVYTIVRTQPRNRYLRLNRYTLLLIPAFFLAVLLHNFVYAMFYPYFLRENGDEGVFFIVALFGIPLYFLVVMLNTIFQFISRKRAGAKNGNTFAGGSSSAG